MNLIQMTLCANLQTILLHDEFEQAADHPEQVLTSRVEPSIQTHRAGILNDLRSRAIGTTRIGKNCHQYQTVLLSIAGYAASIK